MRKKPTTCTVSLWNVTGAIGITSHADEAHKAVCLVDLTVKLGDSETARDLLSGIAKVLELNETEHDYLRDLILNKRGLLFAEAKHWLARNIA